jgi:nucleoside triphosphate pyrophosphatase
MLLQELGLTFQVLDPGPDGPGHSESPQARVLEHARFKAQSAFKQVSGSVILASDTLVWCRHQFLPKPANRSDARRMLKLLDSQTHQVWTGVCVIDPQGKIHEQACMAEVLFSAIPTADLEAYLQGQEWADKAGAYGIQGTASAWAQVVSGGYDTVVGLPLEATLQLLIQAGACPSDGQR